MQAAGDPRSHDQCRRQASMALSESPDRDTRPPRRNVTYVADLPDCTRLPVAVPIDRHRRQELDVRIFRSVPASMVAGLLIAGSAMAQTTTPPTPTPHKTAGTPHKQHASGGGGGTDNPIAAAGATKQKTSGGGGGAGGGTDNPIAGASTSK
jgi:hypothetical protein